MRIFEGQTFQNYGVFEDCHGKLKDVANVNFNKCDLVKYIPQIRSLLRLGEAEIVYRKAIVWNSKEV